jgi:hypothetical protein
MGRFFQAKPIELSQNNIYQPPYELMMAANEYDNKLVAQDVRREQDILDKSVFNFKQGVDDANYNKYNAEISEDVTKIANAFQKNAESKEARKMLYDVNRKVANYYKPGGAIYNIQQTYDNDLAYKKRLQESGLSETNQQLHYDKYLQDFKQANPDGSVGTYYAPDKIIDDINPIPEFIKWFDSNKADVTAKTRETLGNKWITTVAEEKESLIMQNAMKTFVDANPEYKDGIIRQAQSGVYNQRNIVLTPDMNIDYTQGYGKDLQRLALEKNYSRVNSDSITYRENPNYQQELAYQRAAEAAEDERKQKRFVSGVGGEDYIALSANLQKAKTEAETQIVSKLSPEIQAKIKASGKSILDYVKGVKGLENVVTKLEYIDAGIKQAATANFEYFAPGNSEKDEKKRELIQKEFNGDMMTNFPLIPIRFGVTRDNTTGKYGSKNDPENQYATKITKDGKVIKVITQERTVTPQSLIGQKMVAPNGKEIIVNKVYMAENSAGPMIYNSPEFNNKRIEDNDARLVIEIEYYEGAKLEENKRTFQRTAYQPMNEKGAVRIRQTY